MICDYCNKEFKTNSSLNLHIKTAKYCLKIQNEIATQKSINQCQSCLKNFITTKSLKEHLKLCIVDLYDFNNKINKNTEKFKEQLNNQEEKFKEQLNNQEEKYTEQLFKYEQQIKELQKTIEILSLRAIDKHTITNNTTNNKILNIISPLDFTSKEHLKNKINDSYKLDYIFSGQKGIAKFAVDHILKDEEGNLKYVCTDPSRQIFKYKDESGELRKDIEAKKLTNFLVEGGIKDKACDIMNEWWTEETGITNVDKFELLVDKAESLNTIDSDNTEFKKELATMTTI
jgi:hypothetical protein